MQWLLTRMFSERSSLWASFVAITAGVVLVACGPENRPRFVSYSNLYRIGHAIRDYNQDHGELPRQLSLLVPKYISTNDIAVFYPPDGRAGKTARPVDWATNPSRIDEYASYVYLGTNSPHEILAYEKPDLWQSSTERNGKVAVLFSDFHVQDHSILKLEELLHNKAKASGADK